MGPKKRRKHIENWGPWYSIIFCFKLRFWISGIIVNAAQNLVSRKPGVSSPDFDVIFCAAWILMLSPSPLTPTLPLGGWIRRCGWSGIRGGGGRCMREIWLQFSGGGKFRKLRKSKLQKDSKTPKRFGASPRALWDRSNTFARHTSAIMKVLLKGLLASRAIFSNLEYARLLVILQPEIRFFLF